MSEVVQFPTTPRCSRCRSKDVVATLVVVNDGEEATMHFCELHAKAKLEAGLVETLTI